MKLHHFFKEIGLFLTVLVLFVIPSVLNNTPAETVFSEWTFPLQQMIFLVLVCIVLLLEDNDFFRNAVSIKSGGKFQQIKNAGYAFFSFGMLCASAGLFQLSALLLKASSSEVLAAPSSISEWLFCILAFIFSAAFEEILFRGYIPLALKNIVTVKIEYKKVIFYSVEAVAAFIFSICHRYLGIFAVLNAAAAHFSLRFCFIKTKHLFYGVIVHFIYNFLTLFMFIQ